MSRRIDLSPLTRIEGHLAIHTQAEPVVDGTGYRVTEAKCEGEMYRGFEVYLRGRDPLDAQQFVQRICGVCPISHAICSCRAQEMAYGMRPSRNGRLMLNLIFAANYLQSHFVHFYHLSALDFVDVTAVLAYEGRDTTLRAIKAWVEDALARHERGQELFPAAPFLPRYEVDYVDDVDINCAFLAHYVQALDMRRIAHEMAAVFGARLPHTTAIVPGGCTQGATMERLLTYRSRLKRIQTFIDNVFMPDILTAAQAFPRYWDVGAAYGNYLAFGAFDMTDTGNPFFPPGAFLDGRWEQVDLSRIVEDVDYAKFSSPSRLHPSVGQTVADPRKRNAYTWQKAPRYRGRPMEVGPLARVMTLYHGPANTPQKQEVQALLKSLGLTPEKMESVLGRHLCRGLEAKWLAAQGEQWLDEVEIGAPPANEFTLPESGEGYGLTEAPRGALGHWLSIENHVIKNYQCVVPTTWNCSPRDDDGVPGPVEKALEGVLVADPEQPIEVGRVVRSFDPCLACSIH